MSPLVCPLAGLTTASSGSYVYYYSSGAASTGIFVAVCLCYILVKSVFRNSNGHRSSRHHHARLPTTRAPRTRVATTVSPTTTSGDATPQVYVPEPTKPTTWTSQAPPSYFAAIGTADYQVQDQTAVEISSEGGQETVAASTTYPDAPPPPYPGSPTEMVDYQ